jgi:hypothetical protein
MVIDVRIRRPSIEAMRMARSQNGHREKMQVVML